MTSYEHGCRDTCNAIARTLKCFYEDFCESEHDEMDVELGEIYRAHLHNLFKALQREGVEL